MNETIKAQLTILAALQKTENEIARIEKDLVGVDAAVEALNAQVREFEQKVGQDRESLDVLKKAYRSNESEIKSIENRIEKDNEKLRAVKTNKEYQSMLKEIDDLKFKCSSIEDRMLSDLEQIERAEATAAGLKSELAAVQAEVEEQVADIRKKAGARKKELEEQGRQRDVVWAELDPKLQKMFVRVKTQGRGIAVAAVVDGVCQVCRMNIPPQMFHELLRMDEMKLCPNCQRIIYPKILIEED